MELTPRAAEILARTQAAMGRFSPGTMVRASRMPTGVVFSLVDRAEEGDGRVEGDGFILLVEEGLEGIVDVEEPHDHLVLLPPR